MTGSTTEIEWYIARDGQQHGPISDVEMRLFVEQGHLKPSDLVWRAGFADWRPAPVVFPPMVKPAAVLPGQAAQRGVQVEAAPGTEPSADVPAPGAAAYKAAPAPAGPNKAEHAARAPEAGPLSMAATGAARGERSADGAASAAGAETAAKGSSAAVQSSSQVAAAGSSPSTAGAAIAGASGGAVASSPAPSSANIGLEARAQTGPVVTAKAPTPADPQSAVAELLQPRQSTIKATLRQDADDGITDAPRDDVGLDEAADVVERGGMKRLAMAAVLVAMIAGSTFYLFTHKDAILQVAGLGEKPAAVPVVKARPTTVAALEKPGVPKAAEPAPVEPAGAARKSAIEAASDPVSAEPAAKPQPVPVTGEMVPQNLAAAQPVTPPPSAPPTGAAAAPPAPSALEIMDSHYQKSRLWSFMKRQHPDWYDEQVGAAAKLIDDKRPQREATRHMVEAMVALRRRHAESALKADSGRLKGIASAFLANLQSLAQRGPDVCYSFISQGESSPAVIDIIDKQQGAEPLEGQAIAIFEAVAAGKSAPASHERPKKEDYDVLAGELGKLGWSQADLQLFADPKALAKASPERVCKMVRDWFKAHIEISDGAVQERLLFETLRPVVAG